LPPSMRPDSMCPGRAGHRPRPERR
jgi:hypothetical protein